MARFGRAETYRKIDENTFKPRVLPFISNVNIQNLMTKRGDEVHSHGSEEEAQARMQDPFSIVRCIRILS